MNIEKQVREFNTEKFLINPLMIATGCSWVRILHSSGEPVFVPTNHPELNYPTIDAQFDILSLFSASGSLFVSTLLLLDRFKASLDPKLTISDSDYVLNFAKQCLRKAADNNYPFMPLRNPSLLLDSPFFNEGQEKLLISLSDPYVINKGDNESIGIHIQSKEGNTICKAVNHPVDNHPDLCTSSYHLQLFITSPELFEATRWLYSRLEKTLSNKNISDAVDVISFAEKALSKALNKI